MENFKTSQYLKTYAVIILLIGAVWIWMSRTPSGATLSNGIQAPQKGFLAPDFSLPAASGEVITLSDLRGQPVLINYWASWCPPCKAEMPALERVYQEFKEQGFIVLAVNATNQDDAADAVAFSQSLNLSFPILFDSTGEVSSDYLVRALPSTYFVDSYGIIQEVVIGGPMSEALLRIRVQQLIGNTGDSP